MTTPRDPVVLAVASLGTGATTGASVITAGTIALRSLPMPGQSTGAGAVVIWITLLAGVAAAAASGWLLTKALGDLWRRGVIGALSVFGSALLAALAMPADMLGGRAGLAIYLTVLVAAVWYTRGVARRAATR